MKEDNHNTCIVYLLKCIDKHIHSIEMFLACLKIDMKHPKNIDVETCRLRPVTSQCTKWLFPTAAICVKIVSSNETFGYIGCQGKMSAQCHRRQWDAISAVLTFFWHSRCANIMSWHYWTILVGRGPGRHRAIIWTNARILLIGPLGTNFGEILIAIHTFSLKKTHLKMSSVKWRSFCLGLNMLIDILAGLRSIDYRKCHWLYYLQGLFRNWVLL